MRAALLVVLGLLNSGCYTYRPLEQTEPALGDAVRADLNPEASDRLARSLGPRINQLDARVAAMTADTVRFLVRVARTPEGIESYFKDDTVTLPRTSISSMMRRRLSTGQTVALGGLLAAGAIGAAAALTNDTGNQSAPGGGQVSPE